MPVTVTVYTRTNCSLCEDVHEVVDRVASEGTIEVDYVDVDEDPALRETYGDLVPHVVVDDAESFSYRLDEGEFRDAIGRVDG